MIFLLLYSHYKPEASTRPGEVQGLSLKVGKNQGTGYNSLMGDTEYLKKSLPDGWRMLLPEMDVQDAASLLDIFKESFPRREKIFQLPRQRKKQISN